LIGVELERKQVGTAATSDKLERQGTTRKPGSSPGFVPLHNLLIRQALTVTASMMGS
jgi:hypothetical protein